MSLLCCFLSEIEGIIVSFPITLRKATRGRKGLAWFLAVQGYSPASREVLVIGP